MRHSTSRPIRLAIALAVGGTLALTACGDDDEGRGGGDGGGGSTESFCDELAALEERGDDPSFEQVLESLRSLADVTPDEVSDEMGQLVDAFEQLQSFDAESASDEEMARFAAMADELDEASATIEEFAVANCPGLPDDVFGTE